MYTNSSPNNQRGGIVTWIFTTGGFIIHRRSWEFSLPPSEEDRHLRNAFDRLRHASAGNETSKRQSQSPRDATKEREIHFIPSPVKDTSSIIPSSPRWLGRSCSAWVRCRRTHPRSSWNGLNLRRRSPQRSRWRPGFPRPSFRTRPRRTRLWVELWACRTLACTLRRRSKPRGFLRPSSSRFMGRVRASLWIEKFLLNKLRTGTD